jgi:hypothetical protein
MWGRLADVGTDETHAGLDADGGAGYRERVAKGDADPVGDYLGCLQFAVDQNRELITADTGERVGVPNAPLESFAHRTQQLVTACVAEPIVDLFEVIESTKISTTGPLRSASSRRCPNNSRLGSPVNESWCT